MKWPWKKTVAPDYSDVLARLEKRIGGIEAIQTEILKHVTPVPQKTVVNYAPVTPTTPGSQKHGIGR